MLWLLEVLIVPLFAASLAYGQFTSGVNLVEVYATVTDERGQPLAGLTAADFTVQDEGVSQTITAFAPGEVPLAIAVAIDRSFSMASGHGERLSASKAAARALVDALRADDQVMVVAIGSETEVVAPLSQDREAAIRAVDRLDTWGATPLYDAAVLAIDAVQHASGRRALVLLSDGVDRGSDVSAADLLDRARHRDVIVYPIGIGDARPPVFAELAAATGGRSFFLKNASRDLGAEMTAIARELRLQYLIGYAPPSPVAAGWHSIDVTVNRPRARVRARDGYFAR
jgi:Ca-activated chloride channel family protein